MSVSLHELNSIQFQKDFHYAKLTPTFVSCSIGLHDEVARWVLDKHQILYRDEKRPPVIVGKVIKQWIKRYAKGNEPIMIMNDALLYSSDSIIQYWEERGLAANKYLPDEPDLRKEVLDLYYYFTSEFVETRATKFMLDSLLPTKKQARKVLTKQTRKTDRWRYRLFYSIQRKRLTKQYNLDGNTPEEQVHEIRKVFDKVDALLQDGRKYLCGNRCTLADISFAAICAPLILPEEFGGNLPLIQQVPDAYREIVYEFRARVAGQFILKLYQDDRPDPVSQDEIPKEAGILKRWINSVVISLKKKQSKLFHWVQKKHPVIKIPLIKVAVVSSNDLVKDLLHRDLDFTVEEINSAKMANQKGAFFLGMDRNNPQMDRERTMARNAVKRDDLERIKMFVRNLAEDIIQKSLNYERLDVPDKLCKPIFVRLIDDYFGVPAPSERTMRRWLRDLFYDLFLNLGNNKHKHQIAWNAGVERRSYLLQLLKDRKQLVKDGGSLEDNMLNRFLAMQREPGNEWFDDEKIQRQIGGIITGILETSSKAVVLVLDELFNHPEALKKAIAVAHTYDTQKMFGYVQEALRFHPVQPGVLRFNEKEQVLQTASGKRYTIPAKTRNLALTAGAMFDPSNFPNPLTFDGEREAVTYMNYGYALHECYGKYINSVTLSELVAAVLRLPNIRRGYGRSGQGSGLIEESFPSNFVVEFG